MITWVVGGDPVAELHINLDVLGPDVATLLEVGATAIYPPGTVIADAAVELLDHLEAADPPDRPV